MRKQIVLTVVFIITLMSCKDVKRDSKKDIAVFDTIFYETEKKVDTLLVNTAKQSEGIWINKILYKKETDGNVFIIASSLSHNSVVQIDNSKDLLNVKVLGSDVFLESKKFKNFDFIIVQDSTYNSGNLFKTVNTFLIDSNARLLKNEVFSLSSKDNGKTYDNKLETVSERDSIFLRYDDK